MNAPVRNALVPFLSGVVFAVGLVVGGMTEPSKVIGFLDFAGAWDPSLMLVMGGAVAVYFPAFMLYQARALPGMVTIAQLPTLRTLDARLLGGAALFGIGWGLGGYCPGPGIVSVASLAPRAGVFVGSMVAGMLLFQLLDARRRSDRPDDGVDVPPGTAEAR